MDRISKTDLKLFESTPGMRVVVSPDAPTFTLIAASNEMCSRLAMPREEFLGKSIFDAFPANPNDPDFTGHKKLRESLEFVISHQREHKFAAQRYDVATARGTFEEVYWTSVSTPVLENGEVIYIIHTTEDVTNHVKAQHKLDSLEGLEKSFNILWHSPWVIGVALGIDYVLEMANDQALRLWNKPRSIIGKSLRQTIPELEGQGVFELFDKVRTTGETVDLKEVPIIVPNNGSSEIRYFDVLYRPYYEQGAFEPIGVFTMSYDVTETVLARQKVQRSEERLQKMISIETVGVIYFDLNGSINNANVAFEKMSGYSIHDLFSRKVRWDELTPPEFMEVTLKSREEFLTKGQNTPYEKQYIRPDGSRWWGLFAGKRLSENECVEFVLDITPLKQVECELEKRVKERTKELELVNDALLRSNQNLEQFAYAASHDLKEPVRKILLFTDMLRSGLSARLNPDEAVLFDRIENSTRRMNLLIEDLLSYSHMTMQPRSYEAINLNDVINVVLSDLDYEIEERKADIKVQNLFTVQGNFRQLQQLFQNLITNSLKYSRHNASPRIEISYHPEVAIQDRPGKYNVVIVKDYGVGFDQVDSERMFEVFTRLHSSNFSKGSGIGLSIVRKVMDNHNGFVKGEGSVGEGATFKLYFPIV